MLERNSLHSGFGPQPSGCLPASVEAVLRSPSEPLDLATRAFMEPRFGRDFAHVPVQLSAAPARPLTIGRTDDPLEDAADAASQRALGSATILNSGARANFGDVRVHRGAQAAEAARAVRARAFTVGSHVVFGANEYQPRNSEGVELIAHELAHVMQQTATPMGTIRRRVAPDAGIGEPAPIATEVKPGFDAGQPSNIADAAAPGADAQPDINANTPENGPVETKEEKIAAEEKVADAQTIGTNTDTQTDGGKSGEVPDKEQIDTAEKVDEPKSIADIVIGNLALIDEELAEHQRWGTATALVGTAGSQQRAKFVAEAAAGGAESGLVEGFVQGAKMGVGMKVGEKVVEKGIQKGAVALAARLGAQAGKFTPLPGVGAAIGGALAAYDLASRDWKATGEAIGRFGKGASIYDQLANSIEAISNVLEVANQVLNVIAGVLGAITVVMWIISVVTLGAMSPVAGLLTTIAMAIGIATMVLDAINALVLKQLIMTFRALHAFTNEADPRDVVAQGSAISQAAGAATGFVGGFAGGMAGGKLADKGIKVAKGKPPTPLPDHPTPPAATGDGPTVKAEPPVEGKSAPQPSDKLSVNAETTTSGGGQSPIQDSTAPVVPPKQAPVLATKAGISAAEPLSQAPEPMIAPAAKAVAKPRRTAAERKAQAREEDIARTYAQEIGLKRAMSKRSGIVESELLDLPEQRGPQLRRGEKVPGRTEFSSPEAKARIKGELRVTARERFGRMMQDALNDETKHNELTRKTNEYLTEADRDYIRKEGKLPSQIQAHHLFGVADFPEFADRPDVVVGLPEDVHRGAGHGGDPTAPIEAGTLRDLGYEERGPFNIDPEGAKRYRTKQSDVASGKASTGNITKDILAERRSNLSDAKKEIARLNRLKNPARRDAKRLAELNNQVKSLEWEIQTIQSLITKEGTPPTAAISASPSLQGTTSSQEASQPVPAPQATPTLKTTAGIQTAPVTSTVRLHQPTPRSELTPTPHDGYNLSQLSGLRQAAQAGSEAGEKKEEPESGLRRNLRDFSQIKVSSLSTAEKVVLLAGGPMAGAAAATAMHGFEHARREPVIERVNPQYPAPPCAPNAIVSIQNEILMTLAARAEAETTSKAMAAEHARHKANEKPIDSMQKGTEDAISATDAHTKAVERRAEANKQKKEKEAQVAGTLGDYSNRAAKLAAVTVPMKAFSKFASLAYSLPDALPNSIADSMPEFVASRADKGLKNGKQNLIKMHTDSQEFLAQLDAMDKTVNEQKAGQSEREKTTQGDAATLSQTSKQAEESDQTLNQAKQTTADLKDQNKDRIDQADKLRAEGDQTAATLDSQAQQKTVQAQSLGAALQTWAQTHKQTRLDALKQTQKRYEQMGYTKIEIKER